MNVLSVILIAFIPIFTFAFIPKPGMSISDSLYTPRILMLLLVSIFGLLLHLYDKTKSTSLIGYLKSNFVSINILPLMVLLYIVWACVTSFTSSIPGYSWLGHPSLQFGSIPFICCIVLSFLYSKTHIRSYNAKVLSLTVVVMFIITFLESIGLRPLMEWIHSNRLVYPASTVGLRQHLGGWYAVVSLASVFFYRRTPRDVWFWLWLSSSLAGLGLCTNSAATLGVAAGLFFWLLFSISTKDIKAPVISIAGFIVSLIALPLLSNSLSHTLGTSQSNFKSYNSTSTLNTRLLLWKAAINAASDRPITGWGDETFAYQAFEHLDDGDARELLREELGLSKEYTIIHKGSSYYAFRDGGIDGQTGSILYLRAHNIFIDELYSKGLPGLILFCCLILFLLQDVYKRNRESFTPFIISLVPYTVYLLAWFYVPTVTPLYFMLIGLMMADLRNPNQQGDASKKYEIKDSPRERLYSS